MPKLHRLGEAVDDLKLTALRSGNQHPARVCTEVEGSIKRPLLGVSGARRLYRSFRERVRTRGTLGRHDNTPSDIKLNKT